MQKLATRVSADYATDKHAVGREMFTPAHNADAMRPGGQGRHLTARGMPKL